MDAKLYTIFFVHLLLAFWLEHIFCERGIFSVADNVLCGVILPSAAHMCVLQVLKPK